MKFLIFNILVVGAIVYLISKDQPHDILETGSEHLTKITENGERILGPAAKTAGEFFNTKPRKTGPDTVRNEEGKALPHQPSDSPLEIEDVAQEIEERIVKKVPDHQDEKMMKTETRMVEAKASALNPTGTEKQAQSSSKFMSNSDRRRELSRLAREMEVMFANKLSQQ